MSRYVQNGGPSTTINCRHNHKTSLLATQSKKQFKRTYIVAFTEGVLRLKGNP